MSQLSSHPSAPASQDSLEWWTDVAHPQCRRLQARVSICNGCARGVKSLRGPLKCSIEVWTEEGFGEELAYCRGMLTQDLRLRILWLGRSGERSADPRVRGRRSVAGQGAGLAPAAKRPTPAHLVRTVPEAVFGAVVALGELFGSTCVELQACDTGSGKLIQMYETLGFQKAQDAAALCGVPVWMETPTDIVACLAPQDWMADLVPKDVDVKGWLRRHFKLQQACRALPAKPWIWTWEADWPTGSIVEAKIEECRGRCSAEVTLSTVEGIELARGKAVLRLREQVLRVQWLGRTRNRSVHQSVKGKLALGDESKYSASTAVLSVLASLAGCCNLPSIDLQVLDDGSGKLLQHFQSLGFEPAMGSESTDSEVRWLKAQSRTVVDRFLPRSWREALSSEGALSAVQTLLKDED